MDGLPCQIEPLVGNYDLGYNDIKLIMSVRGSFAQDRWSVHSPDSPSSNHHQHLRRLKEWGLGTALVGASLLPCPECGLPLAIHTWPFLLLLAVRRLVKRQTERLDDLPGDENQSAPSRGGEKSRLEPEKPQKSL